MNRFANQLDRAGLTLRRSRTEILQINVGRLCNLTCNHCHVNAGPSRKEIMTRQTMDRVLDWLAMAHIPTVDITGGAPEMNPDFRYLVGRIKALSPARHIIDRCNLTILLEPGYDDLAGFLADNEVEIIASLPCYGAKNVDEQRGDGVFDGSIRALQLLNRLGYGRNAKLPLHLVYNPNGAFLPGAQAELEADYKAELKSEFDIVFDRLFTITNMPIARFAAYLRHHGKYDAYLELLFQSFNPKTVDGLMCRNTLSIGWRGEVYDCDFNQMLDLQWSNGRPLYLWDIDSAGLEGRDIMTGDHCFGCTAGCGSSCGGAISN
ncbi:MAG TPA: arsenosugar biosynthesis radical SAM (seleno)protein ArsS [Candidatus Nitrosotalea sp.]|nr:arsenosugar biosynthesis radical SAM (seleno)protein ArsS [Candidatus Nitrosotalea sp.]